MIGFVTDSPSDLPAELAEQHPLIIIPAVIIIEGQSYIDGQTLSREDFYSRLPTLKNSPTTAAPSVGEFEKAYQTLINRGCQHILSIHTAERLTAICNIARIAAKDFPNQITVIDSASLSLGVGFQVLAGIEAAQENQNLEETIAAITSTRQRIHVAAALDTMDYLRRSGRLPSAVTTLGNLLNVKPVVKIQAGQIKPIHAARTTSQATQTLINFLYQQGPLERLAILHTHAAPRAQAFLNEIMSSANRINLPRDIRILNVTSVIGTHVGLNGLGFAAVQAAP